MDDDLLDDDREPGTPSSRHALLVAALLHLMSQYALRSRNAPAGGADDGDAPCVKLAAVIERHLDALTRQPDAEPVLRATCEQLIERWADLVDSRLPPPRRTMLERLLGRAAPAYAV